MKVNVLVLLRFENLEQVTAELVARGATQALTTPDGAQGMFAAIALLHHRPEFIAKRLGLAKGLRDVGGFGIAQGVVEVGGQLGTRDLGHGHSGVWESSGNTASGKPASRIRSLSFLR